MQITSFKKQQDHFKRLAVDPANHAFRPDGELVPMTPAIRNMIVEKLTHIAEALQDVQNFGGKQATAILKSIQNVIAVHKLEEIKAIFELVKNKPIERRLFLDTVKMAGTNPAIMFFKEMCDHWMRGCTFPDFLGMLLPPLKTRPGGFSYINSFVTFLSTCDTGECM